MACGKYEVGYDDNRFEIEVSESFHCIICFLVLKHPVMCKNQHYYCSFCIKKHLETSAFCPTCLEHLSVDTLKPTPRIVTDYLSELNIRCDFHPRGCLEIVKLKNLERHVVSCGFSPVQCSNDGCNALVSLRDKIYHQSEVCEFRKSKCHDCGQLKQEVKELRVQMMAQQDQMKEEMKEEMKGIKDNVKNEVKKEIKEMTFQMLTRYDLLLAQQTQMKADMKGIKEEVKNEVQQEMKALKVQMLSCQDQREMKSEIFARQDQMKEEIKEDMKASQKGIKVEIKHDLREVKHEILSEVREIVKMGVENMAKEMKDTSKEMKKEMKEIQDQMKLKCSNQSTRLDGKQKAVMPAVENTITPKFEAQLVVLEKKQPMPAVDGIITPFEAPAGLNVKQAWKGKAHKPALELPASKTRQAQPPMLAEENMTIEPKFTTLVDFKPNQPRGATPSKTEQRIEDDDIILDNQSQKNWMIEEDDDIILDDQSQKNRIIEEDDIILDDQSQKNRMIEEDDDIILDDQSHHKDGMIDDEHNVILDGQTDAKMIDDEQS